MKRVLLTIVIMVSCAMVCVNESRGQAFGQFLLDIPHWDGGFYPGGTIRMQLNYTNIGTMSLKVLSITLTTDFGIFTPQSNQPFIVSSDTSRLLDFTVQVPSSAAPAIRGASLATTFQYLDPNNQQWFTPSSSPYIFAFKIPLHRNVSILGSSLSIDDLWYLIGAVVSIVLVIVLMLRRRWVAGPIVTGPVLGRATRQATLL